MLKQSMRQLSLLLSSS